MTDSTPATVARRFWNRLSLWRSKLADAYWEGRLSGEVEPLHPVREIRLLDRLGTALAERRAFHMIAPVCANCRREIDKTPEGWIHVV